MTNNLSNRHGADNISMAKFCKEEPNSIKTIDELYMFDYGVEFKIRTHLNVCSRCRSGQ